MIRSSKRIAAMLAALSIVQVCGASAALPRSLAPSVTIRFDPAELRSAAGAARVYAQLRQAVRTACAGLPPLDRWSAGARRDCQDEALEATIRRLGDARLRAHHRACQRRVAAARCAGNGIAAS